MAEKYNRDKAAEEAKNLTPKEKAELQERLDAVSGNKFSNPRINERQNKPRTPASLREEIYREKSRIKQEETDKKNKLELEDKDKKKRISKLEQKVKNDARWQIMINTANDPLLKEAIKEYFKEFPVFNRGMIFSFKKYFELNITERICVTKKGIEQNVDELYLKNQWFGRFGGEVCVLVNGVRIEWDIKLNKAVMSVVAVKGTHSDSEYDTGPDYVDGVKNSNSVEELADYIVSSIIKKQKIDGLRIN